MGGYTYGEQEPRQSCPYCGDECEASFVDIGVGFEQCTPYYCDSCGACEIGAHDRRVELTSEEQRTGWYKPGRAHLTSGPTLDGVPVKHDDAMDLYRAGILDKAPADGAPS